ncbi:MAG: hypothetical protein HY904_11160 [Deltaproteobacteria bacterium]|nr:hypothetical protein [Deltaproteobacteria bacterium]
MRRLLLGVVLTACASPPDPPVHKEPLPFEPAGPTASPDPSAPGPYPVGVRTVTLVDPTRTTPGYTAPRQLVCEIWYPAVEASRTLPRVEYVLHDQLPDDMKAQIAPEALGTLQTDAARDADIRADSDRYPVVVFSHGKGGIRMQSTFLTVALASHGHVVISPDHEADTLVDLLREGDVELNTTYDSFIDRPLDVMFILDQVEAGDALSWLRPIADMEHVGLAGHSFGALTTMRVSGLDGRVDAEVAQAPAGYALVQVDVPTQLEQYGIPVMLQSAGMDRTLPEDPSATSLWAHLRSPRYFLRMPTAGHFTFSDLCVFDVAAIDAAIPLDVSNVLTDGCGTDNIRPEVAFPIIRHYAVGLFNGYLRSSPAARALLTEAPGVALGGAGTLTFQHEP